MIRLLLALAGYSAVTYAEDVVLRPKRVAKMARAAADKVGKPLLNVGAGTAGSSLRVAALGPTLWGDINCDLEAPVSTACGPAAVCQCDVLRLPWPDRHFGAVIASHVLEHVPDPVGAMRELVRVADHAFVVTPKWWAVHTWAHPGHLWYRREDGEWVRLREQELPSQSLFRISAR